MAVIAGSGQWIWLAVFKENRKEKEVLTKWETYRVSLNHSKNQGIIVACIIKLQHRWNQILSNESCNFSTNNLTVVLKIYHRSIIMSLIVIKVCRCFYFFYFQDSSVGLIISTRMLRREISRYLHMRWKLSSWTGFGDEQRATSNNDGSV